MGMGRRGVKFQDEGREWRFPDLLYPDDLVFCGESEGDLGVMLGDFVELCKRKVNTGKSVDGIRLEHVSEFK